MENTIDTSIIDGIIQGRVDPHIYAFVTDTVPQYLKVGDTYRPVSTRLQEWRNHFKDLRLVYSQSARIDADTIFRDYSVHDFLISVKHRERLEPFMVKGVYYSNEFFKNASPEDVDEAITDIKLSAQNKDSRYTFYSNERLPLITTFTRNQDFEPRDSQRETIDRFITAVQKGRTNLLMYAVMRFGKSFTAMCCALEYDAKLVVIVSAKADVKMEWKKIVESHKYFSEYHFLDTNSLKDDENIITKYLKNGKRISLFLTLQDLQGEDIKNNHKDLFKNTIDILIIDESHYGARAEHYGRVLKDLQSFGIKNLNINKEFSDDDASQSENYGNSTKILNPKVRIHLSGTPYRILMGDEFDKDDIIAQYQFADIVKAQKKWDADHFLAQENNALKEWDNPYYGFPQMIRFAFNLSKSAKAKLEELKASGVTYSLSALFKPKSIYKDKKKGYKEFVYEKEILDLFLTIDGSKADNTLLGFLDYDKIKEGQMCRHIVVVLPFKASCDALEALLLNNRDSFKNLSSYEILNIAGHDNPYATTEDVKSAISRFENVGKKTITLTVNRMLTGSTVPQWDSMLFLKDTSSPQEYDQAIFRIQNQYVKTYVKGGDIIKYNMKPQTLFVDFSPERMFCLQEMKSLFYNTNTNQRGNDELRDRIKVELEISPIITLNAGKMEIITPQNIIDVVRNYSQDKSILDEALLVPFDKTLLEVDEIKKLISSLKPLDNRKGIELTPAVEGNTELDLPPTKQSQTDKQIESEAKNKIDSKDAGEDLQRKLAAYYMRILFYAFLTDEKVSTLKQIILSLDSNDENMRIAKHVGLDPYILNLLFENADTFNLSSLDGKIENINTLSRDGSLSHIERAERAMNKLSRISESEVVTPRNVASDLVNMIPKGAVSGDFIILDLASKQGEIAFAAKERFRNNPNLKIYSVVTSPLTYELTLKVYKFLDLPQEHVLNFDSFSLLGGNADTLISRLKNLHPNAIIFAPPYNKSDGGGRKGSGSGMAIYQHFYFIAKDLNPDYISIYLKSSWYSGGKGEDLERFRYDVLNDKHIRIFNDYPTPTSYVDSNVNLRGGVCTFLRDKTYEGDCYVYNHINKEVYKTLRPLCSPIAKDILLRFNDSLSIISKILSKTQSFISECAFPRNVFKLQSNVKLSQKKSKDSLKVYLPKQKVGYISQKKIFSLNEKIDLINSWKVIVAKASPGEDELPHAVISKPIISEPGSLCTDSHLLVKIVGTKEEAENMVHYMNTRFFRFSMFVTKNNHNMKSNNIFRFVPDLPLDRKWDDSMLYEQFGISESEIAFIEKLVREPRIL